MAWLLYQEGLKSKFSRSYRASIDRISQLSIIVPNYKKQQETMKEIYELENQIYSLEKKLSTLESKKLDIVSKFLN